MTQREQIIMLEHEVSELVLRCKLDTPETEAAFVKVIEALKELRKIAGEDYPAHIDGYLESAVDCN